MLSKIKKILFLRVCSNECMVIAVQFNLGSLFGQPNNNNNNNEQRIDLAGIAGGLLGFNNNRPNQVADRPLQRHFIFKERLRIRFYNIKKFNDQKM